MAEHDTAGGAGGAGVAGRTGVGRRGRPAVAASIVAVVLIGGYFAASPASGSAIPATFAVNAVVLVLAFWFPAMRVASPREVLGAWKALLPWLLGWTLVWDLASSGIVGRRDLFQEWWLVYPAGVVGFLLLLLFHGLVVNRVGGGASEE